MRIERLTVDNARSQGAKHRAWYARHNPAHLRGVSDAIDRALAARAAAKVGNRSRPTALVLGAGACTEVPLERLAACSVHVTLVDLDFPALRRARDELPRAARARVDLLRADLSGGVCAALNGVMQAAQLHEYAHSDTDLLLEAAASCLDRCPVSDLPVPPKLTGQRFGLVVSSLVLTQLFGLPLLDALDRIALVSREAASVAGGHQGYANAVHTFKRRVTLSHLNLLATLAAPDGVALLITDVKGYLIPRAGDRSPLATREALPLLPPSVVDLADELGQRFVLVGAPGQWEWQATPPTVSTPGRTYAVEAYVMRAKVQSPVL